MWEHLNLRNQKVYNILFEGRSGLLLWNQKPDVFLNTSSVLTGPTPTHSLIHFRSALLFGVECLHRVGKTRRKTRWTHWIHFGNRWLSDFKPDRKSKIDRHQRYIFFHCGVPSERGVRAWTCACFRLEKQTVAAVTGCCEWSWNSSRAELAQAASSG